jgi:anti-anti-sigma factor
VVVYSVGLIEPASFRAILRIRRMEFVWALVALVGVVALGTLEGILVAIIASLVALAYQVAVPPVYALARMPGTNVFRPSGEHPDDETVPGLLLVRVEGRIFFANAGRIGERLRELLDEHAPTAVALDMSGVPDLEYSALKMLIQGERQMRERGVALHLVGLSPSVLAMVRRSTLGETLGQDRMHFNLQRAVRKFLAEPSRGAEQAAQAD